MGERRYQPGAWQMPQGGVDRGEPLKKAAFRELKEETGVSSAIYLARTKRFYRYDFPKNILKSGSFHRGQKQKWFLMEFTGDDSEINIHMENYEFTQWKWSTREEILSMIVDFKRPIYNGVFTEFKNFFMYT